MGLTMKAWRANPELPADLIYVSRRITTEIVRRDQGRRPPLRKGGGFGMGVPPGFSVEASLPEPAEIDYSNIYELAARATHIVAHDTLTIDRTGPRFADIRQPFLRIKTPLQMQDIGLGVWERAENHPVAAFCGYEYFPGVGRVFFGLVGSAHNHLPEGSIAFGGTSGRTPSHAAGLYDIINATRELSGEQQLEPAVSPNEMSREAAYCPSVEQRFSEAVSLFAGSAMWAPSTYIEALVQVHHYGEKVDVHLESPDGRILKTMDKVVLGAPVWIGHLDSSDFEFDENSGNRVYQRDALEVDRGSLGRERAALAYRAEVPDAEDERISWMVGRPRTFPASAPLEIEHHSPLPEAPEYRKFDEWLAGSVRFVGRRARTFVLREWPPTVEQVQPLCKWFVEQAMRIGPDPVPFAAPVRRGIWRRDIGVTHDGYGWVLRAPISAKMGHLLGEFEGLAIVLTDGRLYESSAGGMFKGDDPPWWSNRIAELQLTPQDASVIAAQVLMEVVEWRRPLYGRDGQQVLRIGADGTAQLWDERFSPPRQLLPKGQ